MYSDKVIKILANSGYDFNYQITEDHILSLMQAAYIAGIHSDDEEPPQE